MQGFTHVTPMQMLMHLQSRGEDLDCMDVKELMGKLAKLWEVMENPATKFARDNKIEHQLIKAGLTAQ